MLKLKITERGELVRVALPVYNTANVNQEHEVKICQASNGVFVEKNRNGRYRAQGKDS